MNGLSSMKFPLDGLSLFMMGLLVTQVYSATEQNEQLPTEELLEFIADWETNQGEWVGPALFEDDSFDQIIEEDRNNEQDNDQTLEEIEDTQ